MRIVSSGMFKNLLTIKIGNNLVLIYLSAATSKLLKICLYILYVRLHALTWISYSAPVRVRKHCKSRRIFMLYLIVHVLC